MDCLGSDDDRPERVGVAANELCVAFCEWAVIAVCSRRSIETIVPLWITVDVDDTVRIILIICEPMCHAVGRGFACVRVARVVASPPEWLANVFESSAGRKRAGSVESSAFTLYICDPDHIFRLVPKCFDACEWILRHQFVKDLVRVV